MNKNFSKVCLSVLALSLLGQGVSVAAQTDLTTTTTEEVTTVATSQISKEPSTTTLEATTTETTTSEPTTSEATTSEPTTSEATTETTTVESTTETTTVETTQETTTTTTAEDDVEESLRRVGGAIDTVALVDGRLVFKVRLDSLIYDWYSDIDYRITDLRTGLRVDEGGLGFDQIHLASLKNRNFVGEYGFYNVVTESISAHKFSANPFGTYRIEVFGTAKSGYEKAFGTVNISRTVSLADHSHATSHFDKVGGVLSVVRQPDGRLTYQVNLNRMIYDWNSDVDYQIIHKKTGTVVYDGSLHFNEMNINYLADTSYWGSYGFYNVASGEIPSYAFEKDPKGDYRFSITGTANTTDSDVIFGVVRLSKDLSFDPKKPQPKPLPAGQKEVYRLHDPKTKNYAYTTSVTERTSLVKKGWKYEGVAWRTETTKGQRVYRLYNGKYYFYTKNLNEYRNLTKKGWKPEGTAYRSYGPVRIMRLANPKTKQYFYTRHTSERDKLVSRGWKYEGTAWFSQP